MKRDITTVRDLWKLKAELEGTREEDPEAFEGSDDAETLAELVDLEDNLPRLDTALIHEDDFEDYARQFAEDIGAVSESDKWPATCIDWKEAAQELQSDFSILEYQGSTYYYQE